MTISETSSPAKKAKARLTSAFKQLWSLHWWMALCYLLLFVVGAIMADLPREYIVRKHAYIFHKSLGAFTLGLLTLRIFILQRVWWRKYTHRLPKFTGKWIRRFLLHVLIYVFMLAVPISGFFLSNSFQSNNVSFFWMFNLPDIFPENRAVVSLARNAHFWLSYAFLGFIILHGIDQLKYVRSLWRRMTKALAK
ncbi:MAG: cytochrome b [Cyanobacteria bacterium P01_E01_bin.42]